MKYKYTSHLMILLGIVGIIALACDIWNTTATTLFLSMGTSDINQLLFDIWSTAFLTMSLWTFAILIGIKKICYGLPFILLLLSYYSADAIVDMWFKFHTDLLSIKTFHFLYFPSLFLSISIILLMLINIACLISWYIESKTNR